MAGRWSGIVMYCKIRAAQPLCKPFGSISKQSKRSININSLIFNGVYIAYPTGYLNRIRRNRPIIV